MKIPDLAHENYEEVYDTFEQFEPNRLIKRIGFGIMHLTHASEMHYVGDAEDMIQGHIESGGRTLIQMGPHTSIVDSAAFASVVYHPPFSRLRVNTKIPAKRAVFGYPIIGNQLPNLGAYPAYRAKPNPTDEERELQRKSTDRFVKFNVDHIDNGGDGALFTQGERDKDNPEVVKRIRSGMPRIAVGVKEPGRLQIVTLGLAFKWKRYNLRPTIVAEEPFSPVGMSQEEVHETAHAKLQNAITIAYDLAA